MPTNIAIITSSTFVALIRISLRYLSASSPAIAENRKNGSMKKATASAVKTPF